LINLIISGKEYMLWSFNELFFSGLWPFHPSSVQIFSSAPFPQIPSVSSSFHVRDRVTHPYKTKGKIIVLYIILHFCTADEKINGSELNASKHYPSLICSKFPHDSEFDLLL
jgi:hypothetical protein